MASYPIEEHKLHQPALDEVAGVLQEAFQKNFKHAQVNVVDCPDLTQDPFHLAAPGLNGNPKLADVGGVPYLVPLPNLSKKYDLSRVAEQAGLKGGFVLGAGAGPCHVVGTNSEMVCNFCGDLDGRAPVNNSHVTFIKDEKPNLQQVGSTDCALMHNVLISEGRPGKVLEVRASVRTGEENMMSCMRKALAAHYGDKPVALGGAFVVEKGKAKIHVMPKFSETPLESDKAVAGWLKFFDMSGPLICCGEVISCDPGWDLRVEHFHCFSRHGEGGHYHFDVTPDEVSYRGYFIVPSSLVRVDRPEVTHNVGRD